MVLYTSRQLYSVVSAMMNHMEYRRKKRAVPQSASEIENRAHRTSSIVTRMKILSASMKLDMTAYDKSVNREGQDIVYQQSVGVVRHVAGDIAHRRRTRASTATMLKSAKRCNHVDKVVYYSGVSHADVDMVLVAVAERSAGGTVCPLHTTLSTCSTP